MTVEEHQQQQQKEGAIIATWGAGTAKKTMLLHVRKSYYEKLGWNIGDFVYMTPDYENETLTIKRVDLAKLQNQQSSSIE